MKIGQRGAAHILPILLIVAAVGLISYLLISSTAPFKGGLFNSLFPKSQSHAAAPGVLFLDSNNNPITQTTTPNIKLELNAPWPIADSGFQLVKTANAQTSGQTSVTVQVRASNDDVNEVNGRLDPAYGPNYPTVWLGNGGVSNGTSYTGLRFSGVSIPRGAKITGARIQVYSVQNQWSGIVLQIAAEAAGNSQAFSSSLLPSKRSLTQNKVSYNANVNWAGNTWIDLGDLSSSVQEVVSRTDWNSGNALAVIVKGNGGGAYSRKFVRSFDGGAANAARLVLTYTSSGGPVQTPSSTPRPSNTSVPTRTPTPTNPPTPAPTQTPKVVSAVVAEDSNFTQNVKNVSFSSNPMVTDYTLSSGLGVKTVYVKYNSNTGQNQIFQGSIEVVAPTQTPMPSMPGMGGGDESMALQQWQPGAKNTPNPQYDKCDDGTDVSLAHKQYYVVAYDGKKYPTWHPAVVTNPITGVGKCYFGHEHGSDPQKYIHWDEIYQHFGKDIDGDGKITPLVIGMDGKITAGDRAGLPFGIANEHMEQYYNQEGRDSIFVRHEDHVGHKVEFVNKETDINTNLDGNVTASTHEMAQLPGTSGLNVPYYTTGSEEYKPTGVVCTHLHKFHQGTHSGDAIRNNLHEVIFHSECDSVDVNNINAPSLYPNNTILLTGMMSFGNPGEYLRFCFADRSTKVCPDGKNPDGSCIINDPLLSKMPNAIHSDSLGRNMVDKYCLDNWTKLNPGNNYFGPYELWQGDLAIYKTNTLSDSTMIAEHGRQWDVLDPIRFVDPNSSTGFSYNSENCKKPGGAFDQLQFVGGCASRSSNIPWNSPDSGFRGLKRTTYFGRNHIQNSGGAQIWWTDPLGGNAVSTPFASGLKQKISPVNADIQKIQSKVQQLYGGNNFLNDRAIQRSFNDGSHTVHAPN